MDTNETVQYFNGTVNGIYIMITLLPYTFCHQWACLESLLNDNFTLVDVKRTFKKWNITIQFFLKRYRYQYRYQYQYLKSVPNPTPLPHPRGGMVMGLSIG